MSQHRRFVSSLAWCLKAQLSALCLVLPATAEAAPKDAPASALADRAMQSDYAGTAFKKAEQKLKKALGMCGRSGCSERVLARLHLDLATVYIVGTKQGPKGKAELKLALAADPDAQLDDELATTELREAFRRAGGRAAKVADDSPAESTNAPADEAEKKPEAATESEPAKPAGQSHKNWLSVSFQQDFMVFSAQNDVCASNFDTTVEAPHYACFQGGSQFGYASGQDIRPGPGNHVAAGVGRATSRLLLGFDRLLGPNFSVGARVGFAFGGGPATLAGGKLLAFHGEIRANYWIGHDPFASAGVRPYVSLSAGIAELDGRVLVEYYDPNGAKGTLDAWRKTGNGFAGLGLGVMIPFAGNSGIVPEARALEMLGAQALGFDVALGYAYGF